MDNSVRDLYFDCYRFVLVKDGKSGAPLTTCAPFTKNRALFTSLVRVWDLAADRKLTEEVNKVKNRDPPRSIRIGREWSSESITFRLQLLDDLF